MSANNSNNNARKQIPTIKHHNIGGNATPSRRESNPVHKRAVGNPVPGRGGKKGK